MQERIKIKCLECGHEWESNIINKQLALARRRDEVSPPKKCPKCYEVLEIGGWEFC